MVSFGCQLDWMCNQLICKPTGNKWMPSWLVYLKWKYSHQTWAAPLCGSQLQGNPRKGLYVCLFAFMSCWQANLLYSQLLPSCWSFCCCHFGWHQSPCPSAFQHRLNKNTSLGMLQTFSSKLGLLRHPAVWTEQLLLLTFSVRQSLSIS